MTAKTMTQAASCPDSDTKPLSSHCIPGRVLIAEDEALVGMFLVDLVEEIGFHPIGPEGDPASALAAAEQAPPELAIVDISLKSGRDGLDLARTLTQRFGTKVIIMSGHGRVESWPEIQQLQPAAILEKPASPGEIEAALRQVSDFLSGK